MLSAAVVHGQDEPPPFTIRPVTMFNQHLYYGTYLRPRAIAVDRKRDEVWVADTGNALIGIVRPDGAELYAFASKEYLRDPARIAIAPNGLLAVIEGNRERVRTFDYRGNYKGDLPLPALGEKPILSAIAYDAAGNFYAGDSRTGQVFVYTPSGKLKYQFGSQGTDDGQFQSIAGMTVDSDGTLYVIDARAIPVQAFDNQGNFLRGWGRHEMGAANFSLPSGVAVDGKGHVFVSDELRHQVKIFSTSGKFLAQFGGLGQEAGELSFPTDVAVDGKGRIYVTERTTSRVQVFESIPTNNQ